MATGGADALTAVWDTRELVCTQVCCARDVGFVRFLECVLCVVFGCVFTTR
jgi:hypothetical protein